MSTPAAARALPVSEVFGPTFQGEGPSAGQLAGFVRLGGCNLTCSGCDTAYTWDASRYDLRQQIAPFTVQDITDRLPDTALTVLTGGEPLLYQARPAFADLIDRLVFRGRVEVETNGTIKPATVLTCRQNLSFNVSPKLPGPISDDPAAKRLVPEALARFAGLARTGRAWFKFVCTTGADVDAAAELAGTYRIPAHRVWVMPAGTDPGPLLQIARTLADPALAHGFHLTLRQHVLLWPDTERGR